MLASKPQLGQEEHELTWHDSYFWPIYLLCLLLAKLELMVLAVVNSHMESLHEGVENIASFSYLQ